MTIEELRSRGTKLTRTELYNLPVELRRQVTADDIEPEDRNFAVGDLVELRSGSPLLTVCEIINEGGSVVLKWFQGTDENATLSECTLPLAVLKKVEN